MNRISHLPDEVQPVAVDADQEIESCLRQTFNDGIEVGTDLALAKLCLELLEMGVDHRTVKAAETLTRYKLKFEE